MSKKLFLPVDYTKLNGRKKKAVREQYVEEQGGLCSHCKTDLAKEPHKVLWVNSRLFPRGFMNNPVHLHHDHNTGMTLGAVHSYCNAVLWQYHGE